MAVEVVVPDREPIAELEIVSNSAERPDAKPYTVRLDIDRERVRQAGSDARLVRGTTPTTATTDVRTRPALRLEAVADTGSSDGGRRSTEARTRKALP